MENRLPNKNKTKFLLAFGPPFVGCFLRGMLFSFHDHGVLHWYGTGFLSARIESSCPRSYMVSSQIVEPFFDKSQ